jgi:acetyl esterase/lipase
VRGKPGRRTVLKPLRTSTRTEPEEFTLRGLVLTASAYAFVAFTLFLAYAMMMPVRWNGLGRLGGLALLFPLHLLAFTLIAAALAVYAYFSHARLATRVFFLAGAVSAALAFVPTIALWQRARELHVPLSFGDYFANAWHLNTGRPQHNRTVVYGTTPTGKNLLLDVWSTNLGDTGPLRPAIVMVHGEAWAHRNRSSTPDWNRWLNSLGYEVFDVEYRMPPPVRWQDEVGDVKAALGWVGANAAQYHVDPKRISLMGGSTGGSLALVAAYSTDDLRLPSSIGFATVTVRSVIDLYAPADLAMLYYTTRSPGYVRPLLREYIGGAPEEFPDRYWLLSPLGHVDEHAIPTLTIIGRNDRVVSFTHARRLNEALAEAGVFSEVYALPAVDHGFDINWGGFGTQIARARIKAFLRNNP